MPEITDSLNAQDAGVRLKAVAGAIQSRLFRIKTAGFFQRFTPWFVVAAFPVILILRFSVGFSRLEAIATALILAALWIVTGLIVGYSRKPDLLSSLGQWDAADGKKDLFSSAWFFENERRAHNRELSGGELLHVNRAAKAIDEVPSRLPKVLTLPRLGRAFAALAILAIAAVTFLPTALIDQGEQLLTQEMQAEANKQSDRLRELAADLEKMAGKDDVDKSELEKLRNDVEEAAENLAHSDGQTANEMLESLEARARAAEKLAEKLGTADNAWASDEMIFEMSQHADLADLAVTIKDKAAASASSEADQIAGALALNELPIETRDRITTALERTIGASIESDKTKVVGERVGNASRKMQDQQPKTAAREFAALAAYFRTVQQRNDSQKMLEELANQLRDAGSKISGSKLQKMQQLTGGNNAPKGNAGKNDDQQTDLKTIAEMPTPLPNQPMPKLPGTPQPWPDGAPELQPGAPQAVPTPVPGMAEQGVGQKGKKGKATDMMAAPVPGQKPGEKGNGDQKGLAMNPEGNSKGSKGTGTPRQSLMAPVPGMAPPGAPQNPGAMAGQPGGQTSGGSGQSAQAGNGGLEAGQGTAALGEDQSNPLKATQDATVVAQTGDKGDSTSRAVEGKARTEAAQRQSREIIINAVTAEEQALDGKSLPLSRKEHVQRYFSEIRKQFEKAE